MPVEKRKVILECKYNEHNNELHSEIKDTIRDNGCTIDSLVWRSTYNNYVVYDYQPFCSDGFNIEMEYSGDKNSVLFVEQLINNRLNNIRFLKRCLNVNRRKEAGTETNNTTKEI